MKVTTLTALLLIITGFVSAELMDVHTHDVIIEKLEESLTTLDRQQSAGVEIRLADLYADRARLKAMAEGDKNCVNCLGSQTDRANAIANYEKAVPSVSGEIQARIFLQTAHLYILNAEPQNAEKIFLNVVRRPQHYGNELTGESYAGLGEIEFRRGNFKLSKTYFERSLAFPVAKPDQIRFRLAWCYFNLGLSHYAITELRNLLKSGLVSSSSLRKDMTRDFATFIAREQIDSRSINDLLAVSEPDDRKANLFHLGKEADRLGNRQGSLLIWQKYGEFKDVGETESLEIQIRTAQTLWDDNAITESLRFYHAFYKDFLRASCPEQQICDELRARSRTYVHTWIKKDKTRPTTKMLGALEIYLEHNPEDTELVQWAGHISRYLGDNRKATNYYNAAADLSLKELESEGLGKEKFEFTNRILNGSLLAEIECAEALKDFDLRERAYIHYLKLNPNGSKIDDVRYQLVYLEYQRKNYQQASEEFHILTAGENHLRGPLRVQAADLSLDSLALLNKSEDVEVRAADYANRIPTKRSEYLSIARRAAVTTAISMFNKGKANESRKRKALTKISAVSLIGAPPEERLSIYKNRILIAENIRDIAAVEHSAAEILRLVEKNPKISRSEREFAFERILWAQELRLDFKSAFRTAKWMGFPKLKSHARALKLALLADLSGAASRGYYDEFIRETPSIREANIIRAKLIREANQPWPLVREYSYRLRRTPDIYSSSVLIAFSKDHNYHELRTYLSETAIRKSNVFSVLNRFDTMTKDMEFNRKLSRHRLDARNDQRLQRTFAERTTLLRQAEDKAKYASSIGDFTLQIIAFERVAREYDRLYIEFTRMRIPRGLNFKQRQEYVNLVRARSQPFKKTADDVRIKIRKLWNDSNAVAGIIATLDSPQSSIEIRPLVIDELNVLKSYAPSSEQRKIQSAMSRSSKGPSYSDITRARAALRRDPFDKDNIRKLKAMEEKRGSYAMATYLESRLSSTTRGSL